MPIVYHTENFSSPEKWIKRILFTTIFMGVMVLALSQTTTVSSTNYLILFCIYITLIISGQFEELTISETELILEQKSIVPFLRSKRIISLKSITDLKTNSDYVHDYGKTTYYFNKKQNLEVHFSDGKYEIINGGLHDRGIIGLIELITPHMEHKKSTTNSTYTPSQDDIIDQ